MLADYGDVIPRREFEAMESSYSVSQNTCSSIVIITVHALTFVQNLEAELESVKGDHTALMAEHKYVVCYSYIM